MTILSTFADTNEAINHAFKEEAVTYKYVADDFKEGKATHSLASKVFGNHHFKGPKPRNNFGETSRTCSLSIKGGFFENLKFDDEEIIGVQKGWIQKCLWTSFLIWKNRSTQITKPMKLLKVIVV